MADKVLRFAPIPDEDEKLAYALIGEIVETSRLTLPDWYAEPEQAFTSSGTPLAWLWP